MNSKVDALKKRMETLSARLKLVKNREAMREQKDSTRRKILVGTYYLEQANKDGKFEELVELMDKFLTRDSDRRVFGLKPISK